MKGTIEVPNQPCAKITAKPPLLAVTLKLKSNTDIDSVGFIEEKWAVHGLSVPVLIAK